MRVLIYGSLGGVCELDWSNYSPEVVSAYLNLLYNPLMAPTADTMEDLGDLYGIINMTGDKDIKVRVALARCIMQCDDLVPLIELFRFLVLYNDLELVTILTCHLNRLFDANSGRNDSDDAAADLGCLFADDTYIAPTDYHLFNSFNAYATKFLLDDCSPFQMCMRRAARCELPS